MPGGDYPIPFQVAQYVHTKLDIIIALPCHNIYSTMMAGSVTRCTCAVCLIMYIPLQKHAYKEVDSFRTDDHLLTVSSYKLIHAHKQICSLDLMNQL